MRRCHDVTVATQFAGSAARDYYGQRIVIVLIAVAHAAAIENEGVIQQRAVAVRRGPELLEKIGQKLGVVAVD